MTARWLVLGLLAYVALDFANPLMPGAVSFALEESVDAVHAERHGTRLRADAVAPPSEPVRVERLPLPRVAAERRTAPAEMPRRTAAVVRSSLPSVDLAPPGEDH